MGRALVVFFGGIIAFNDIDTGRFIDNGYDGCSVIHDFENQKFIFQFIKGDRCPFNGPK